MTYTPNFSDPRVRKRIKHAFGFSRACLSADSEHSWSKTMIDKHFGSQNHALSKWLRDVLLICTDNSYSKDTGQVKKYILNKDGYNMVKYLLEDERTTYSEIRREYERSLSSLSNDSIASVAHLSEDQVDDFDVIDDFERAIVKEWADRTFGAELESAHFEYSDKADRLWHPLQQVRREFKKDLLAEAGFIYEYDIEACAPTLILQHAQFHGMDEYLFALMKYLNKKNECREHVAKVGNIPVKKAKALINALFCGARLGNNKDFALYRFLKGNVASITALQEDEFITQLKADIKKCWDAIEPSMTRIEIINPNTGKRRKKALDSKRKWGRYFYLERLVLNVVRDHLVETGNEHFLEHDGWSTKRPVDEDELRRLIGERTGFNVALECKIKSVPNHDVAEIAEYESYNLIRFSEKRYDKQRTQSKGDA